MRWIRAVNPGPALLAIVTMFALAWMLRDHPTKRAINPIAAHRYYLVNGAEFQPVSKSEFEGYRLSCARHLTKIYDGGNTIIEQCEL